MAARGKRYVDVHLRISPEGYRMLWSLATASGRTLGGVVEDLVLNVFTMPVEKCPQLFDVIDVIESALSEFYRAVRDRELGKDVCISEKSRGEFNYWFCRLFVLYLYGYMHDLLSAIEDGRIRISDVLDLMESEFGDPKNWRNLVESARITLGKLVPLFGSKYRQILIRCRQSQSGSEGMG